MRHQASSVGRLRRAAARTNGVRGPDGPGRRLRVPRPHRRVRNARRGFTLIEAALTMTIIGVGVLSMLQLIAAGTSANVDGSELTTGINLSRNVRELTLKKTFGELLPLNGQTFNPPIDSRQEPIPGFEDWTQRLEVRSVATAMLTTNTVDPDPDVVRLTATVTHNGKQVSSLSWYRYRPN